MRLTWTIVLLSLLASLTVTARTEDPYFNRQYQFGFSPPYDWWKKTHPDALVIYVEPERARPAAPRPMRESNQEFIARLKGTLKTPINTVTRMRANITVTVRSAAGLSLEQYAREARAKSAKSSIYRILGEKSRRLGGSPAMEHLIRISLPGEPVVQTREVFCLHNGRVITLTLAAPLTNFRKYSSLYDKTLASFVWRQ